VRTILPAVAGLALIMAPATLPPELDRYITKYVNLTPAQRADLLAGRAVTKLLDSDPSKEVAVFGATWIAASMASYVAAVRDIERLESGENFIVTKKIGDPPSIDDFAQLRVPDDDAEDLRTCKVGQCQIKLPQSAIERVRREVNWSKSPRTDLNRIARELALDYVKSYLAGGNDELAVYRDAERPTFVATEFRSMIERLPSLAEFLPDLKRYLLDFPKTSLANSESFLYWQQAKFGLKPTLRINHVVITQEADHVVVASKMLYASHYFWTALEVRVLLSDPGRGAGFWFVTISRSRSDGLTGFVGRVIRGKVRDEAEKGIAAVLASTRAKLESIGK
jgi:hypothetical protein